MTRGIGKNKVFLAIRMTGADLKGTETVLEKHFLVQPNNCEFPPTITATTITTFKMLVDPPLVFTVVSDRFQFRMTMSKVAMTSAGTCTLPGSIHGNCKSINLLTFR